MNLIFQNKQILDNDVSNISCRYDTFEKLSTSRGALAWFHSIQTCNVRILKYWMILSLKVKLHKY
jgi:hypothetical protein